MSVDRARELRKQMTEAEMRLWSYLRTLKAQGFHFRKQAPIGQYVVDFCCHTARLVIEVDGGQHGLPDDEAKDAERTKWLEGRGYHIVRYWNNDVISNLAGIVVDIEARLPDTPTPIPPRKGEGL
jgi:very-short-patch-repair endonuclease